MAVPVIILAGFLGSGKTTLLNHVLRRAAGNRIGVLVNDFGAINIDAMLVAGQSAGSLRMGNGCLCCTVDSTTLASTLTTLVRPAAGIDTVIIEASGIAEPRTLVTMLTTIDDRRIGYGGLVYVIDAVNIEATRSDHPELADHIRIADLIVINKSDLVGDNQIDRVIDWVRGLNPTSAVVVTCDGVVDPAVLFDARHTVADDDAPRQLGLDELLRADAEHHAHHDHRHLHDHYQSVEFHTDEPMDPRRLARVFERPPRGCFRMKGVVHLGGEPHRYVVQGVGGFVRAERGSLRRGTARTSSIVAIGSDLDTDAVRAALRDAVWQPGTDDENGILRITRYLHSA